MFNILPTAIRMLSSCSVVGFKSQRDSYLRNIVDLPCQTGFDNSLDGGKLTAHQRILLDGYISANQIFILHSISDHR